MRSVARSWLDGLRAALWAPLRSLDAIQQTESQAYPSGHGWSEGLSLGATSGSYAPNRRGGRKNGSLGNGVKAGAVAALHPGGRWGREGERGGRCWGREMRPCRSRQSLEEKVLGLAMMSFTPAEAEGGSDIRKNAQHGEWAVGCRLVKRWRVDRNGEPFA